MIAENIKYVRDRIAERCVKAGRDPQDITLIAVSKTVGAEAIKEAIESGIKDFGENRAQDLRDKAPLLPPEIHWHFIGHLQSNKIKYVVGTAKLIHSIDTLELAVEVNEAAQKRNIVQKILLEVKTSGEESKFGITSAEKLFAIAEAVKNLKNLDFCGLMTMAPLVDDEAVIRNSFRTLRKLKDELESAGFILPDLSMGMTGDFEFAIDEGATLVRIGTAIFGERNYKD